MKSEKARNRISTAIFLTASMLLWNGCATTERIYVYPELIFPNFPPVEDVRLGVTVPAERWRQIAALIEENGIGGVKLLVIPGSDDDFRLLSEAGGEAGVYMPSSLWFLIADYKMDVDGLRMYMEKLKEAQQ